MSHEHSLSSASFRVVGEVVIFISRLKKKKDIVIHSSYKANTTKPLVVAPLYINLEAYECRRLSIISSSAIPSKGFGKTFIMWNKIEVVGFWVVHAMPTNQQALVASVLILHVWRKCKTCLKLWSFKKSTSSSTCFKRMGFIVM